MMAENWKPVPGFEDTYEVSDVGNVRSIDRVRSVISPNGVVFQRFHPGKALAIQVSVHGYRTIMLWKDKRGHRFNVSNLVVKAFVGPRPAGCEVCHNNGCKTDDRLENLRYDTHAANQNDRLRHGTAINGERVAWSKLKEADVRYIRENPKGLSHAALAREVGVPKSRISKIQRRLQWKHVA